MFAIIISASSSEMFRSIDFQILKYYILMSNLSNGIMASIMYVEIEKIELIFEGIYFV